MGCIDLVRCLLVLRCGLVVVVWYLYGIRMQAEALVPQSAYGYHTTIAKPQRNTKTSVRYPYAG